MSDEAGFLKALESNREDVTTRLVYADWLDERNDPRGEYLRLEAEMERNQARLRELRQQLDSRWLEAVSVRNLSYGMGDTARRHLHLRSGRAVWLEALDQTLTYAGMLEGTPNREWNDRIIDRALRDAESHRIGSHPPHLISPPRRDYLRQPGDMQHVNTFSGRRIPEWLPEVRCIGSFTGLVTVHNPDAHASALTIVWFQEDFAPPLLEPALSQLLDVDWDSLAHDFEY
jgi:uncharacterized protein (TIGR02996 family)